MTYIKLYEKFLDGKKSLNVDDISDLIPDILELKTDIFFSKGDYFFRNKEYYGVGFYSIFIQFYDPEDYLYNPLYVKNCFSIIISDLNRLNILNDFEVTYKVTFATKDDIEHNNICSIHGSIKIKELVELFELNKEKILFELNIFLKNK